MAMTESEAIERLRDLLEDGDTIYTVLLSVSRSGMSRRMNVYVFKNNEPYFLTSMAAAAGCGSYTLNDWHKNAGLRVSGVGFDAGYHVVDRLSHVTGKKLKHKWL